MSQKLYKIKIIETLERDVLVKADSLSDAKRIVGEDYNNCKYVLDADDFKGVQFLNEKYDNRYVQVLKVEPNQYPSLICISNDLNSFRNQIDGNLKVLFPYDNDVAIVVNEDGRKKGLPMNRFLFNPNTYFENVVFGSFLVVGVFDDKFCSLTDKQIEKYTSYFYNPIKITSYE